MCRGADERAVYAGLCDRVAAQLASLKLGGQPLPEATAGKVYSGRFNVRIEPEVHRLLALRAAAEGESLNRFVERQLVRAVRRPWRAGRLRGP